MDDIIERIAVLGAGTMGRGIALAALSNGHAVTMTDIDPETLRAAAAAVSTRANRRRADSSQRLRLAPSVAAAVADATVVIESVPELATVKASVIGDAIGHAPAGALIATNTSTMSIGELDRAAKANGRLVGLHFFNPAEKMVLVEIVIPVGTSAETAGRCQDVARALGKTSIVVQDIPGFVTSRMGLILGNEAMRLLQDGIASATAIDTAMRLGYNHPMGPLELADLVGLDARLNNLIALHEASGDERLRPLEVLVNAVAEGRLGRKSGRGFYDYDENGRRLSESVVNT